MVEVAYNNAKNASRNHTPLKPKCNYYYCASYKKNVNPHSQLKSADELENKFKELVKVYKEKLQH